MKTTSLTFLLLLLVPTLVFSSITNQATTSIAECARKNASAALAPRVKKRAALESSDEDRSAEYVCSRPITKSQLTQATLINRASHDEEEMRVHDQAKEPVHNPIFDNIHDELNPFLIKSSSSSSEINQEDDCAFGCCVTFRNFKI